MSDLSFWFFKEIVLTENYQEVNFNTNSNLTRYLDILLVSDSNTEITFSWNGIDLDGKLKPKEIFEIENIKKNKIFVKGDGSMRIWIK